MKVNQFYPQVEDDSETALLAEKTVLSRIVALRTRALLNKQVSADDASELGRLEAYRSLIAAPFGAAASAHLGRLALGLEDVGPLLAKLRAVLRYLLLGNRITDLHEVERNGLKPDSVCYLYSGDFHSSHKDDHSVVLESRMTNYRLVLDCSLKHFCDVYYTYDANGNRIYHVPSHARLLTNVAAHVPHALIAVHLVTAVHGDTIFGSPLCLVLSSSGKVLP